MAGENNIVDDFELDLEIESISLDDIDISELDEFSTDSISSTEDSGLQDLSLDGLEESEPFSAPSPIAATAEEATLEQLESKASAPLPDPGQGISVPDIADLEEISPLGAAETLNIINETPEPALIDNSEIKPVEEIKRESDDKTFHKEHALEEAYVFNADDEIISIDGQELDQVIYGENTAIGSIPLIDAPQDNETSPIPAQTEAQEELIEIQEITPAPSLDYEDSSVNPGDFSESTETESLDIPDMEEDEEPISLSIDELNDIEVSEDTGAASFTAPTEPARTFSLQSPLNDEFDFVPQSDGISSSPSAPSVPETISLGEPLAIPETPVDLAETTTDKAPDTDVEELYAIYNQTEPVTETITPENEILEATSEDLPELDTSFNLDNSVSPAVSTAEIPPVEEAEIIDLEEDNLVIPYSEEISEEEETVEDEIISESFTAQDTEETEEWVLDTETPVKFSAEQEVEDITLEPVDLDDSTPLTENLTENGSPIVLEPVEMDEEILELDTFESPTTAMISESNELPHSETESPVFTEISEEVVEPAMPATDSKENMPPITTQDSEITDDELTPIEEEISISQNDFMKMASLDEKETSGDIRTNDLEDINIPEPELEGSVQPIAEASDAEDFESEPVITLDETPDFADSLSDIEDISIQEDSEVISIDDDFSFAEDTTESLIIAAAPDSQPDTIDTPLPVPDEIEEDHVELEESALSETPGSLEHEPLNPEMYGLQSSAENPSREEKEQIIQQRVDSLSPDTKDEMKKVLNYLDNLLEDLPEEKIKEFSQSEYYDLYVKILDKLGV